MMWHTEDKHHLHSVLDKNVYPESNYGETVRQMQIEKNSVKQLVLSNRNGNKMNIFKSKDGSRLKTR